MTNKISGGIGKKEDSIKARKNNPKRPKGSKVR